MSEEPIQPLSERELELVQLLSHGLSNKEIARELYISPNTVKVHLRNIYGKLGVGSRTEAMRVAVSMGWVQIESSQDAQTAPQQEAQQRNGALPPEAEAIAPVPLARWQRVCLIASALLVALGLWAVWPGRAQYSEPFPDRPPSSSGWSLSQASRWQSLAQMPTPRRRLAVTAYGGRIYAIAGETSSGVSKVVEVYSPDTDEWTRAVDKPTPVDSVGAVSIADRIYVPGGRMADGRMSDQLEIYAPGTGAPGAWTLGQPMPGGVAAYALATDGEDLYLFGGWDGHTYTAASYRYNPGEDRWFDLAPMPTARAFTGAGTIRGQIYVVGGYDGQTELDTCEVYDLSHDTWAKCAPMSAPRGGVSVSVIADALYAIGGGWQNYLVENEYLIPEQGTWKTFPSPILQEWRTLGTAANGTSLYAIGGWDGSFLGVNQAYRAIFRLYVPQALGSSSDSVKE